MSEATSTMPEAGNIVTAPTIGRADYCVANYEGRPVIIGNINRYLEQTTGLLGISIDLCRKFVADPPAGTTQAAVDAVKRTLKRYDDRFARPDG